MADEMKTERSEMKQDDRIAPGAEAPTSSVGVTTHRGLDAKRRIIITVAAVLCVGLIGISAFALVNNGRDAAASASSPSTTSSNDAVSTETAGSNESQSTSATSGETASSQATDSTSVAATTTSQTTETTSAEPASSDAGSSSTDNGGAASAPGTVTVSVTVSSDAVGGPVSGSTQATFQEGATAYDALCAVGLNVNATQTGQGIYVSAIGGLAEKEHGGSSGWIYTINGERPGISAGSYELSDGDVVSWEYTTTG